MPDRYGVTFAVQDHPQLGDRVLELVHGRAPQRPSALPPVVILAQRLRRLEIQVIAQRVNRPSERLWRYGHRWRVRTQKAWRWAQQQTIHAIHWVREQWR